MRPNPPGVYFGLPHQEYLADPSLSFSGIKALRASPLTYWSCSSMNPNRVDEESQAMAFGTLVHKRILEGHAAFHSAFAVAPEKDDHPEALQGAEALRERCKSLAIKQSGTIAEMCARILEVDPEAVLWPMMLSSFHHAAAASHQKVIPADLARQADQVASMVERAAPQAFSGGHHEVSIFWIDDETGVPLKGRIDYLKSSTLIDLKTFSNSTGVPVAQAVVQAVVRQLYHAQAVIYLAAVEQAKGFFKTSRVFVNNDYPLSLDEAWSCAFASSPAHRFFYIFTESGSATNVVTREFAAKRMDGDETLLFQMGLKHFRQGVQTFDTCRKKYGRNPWVTDHPMRPFRDEEFPLWIQE